MRESPSLVKERLVLLALVTIIPFEEPTSLHTLIQSMRVIWTTTCVAAALSIQWSMLLTLGLGILRMPGQLDRRSMRGGPLVEGVCLVPVTSRTSGFKPGSKLKGMQSRWKGKAGQSDRLNKVEY